MVIIDNRSPSCECKARMNFWLGGDQQAPVGTIFLWLWYRSWWYSLPGHRGPTSARVYKSGVAGGTRRSRSQANDKASGVIFQNGAATYSVDGTARYYLASWGRTHLTLSRGRACAQKGRSQRQRISYLSPRERTRHGIPAMRGAGHGAPDAEP